MNTSLDRYFPFGLANPAGFDTVDNILAVRIHNESKNGRHDPGNINYNGSFTPYLLGAGFSKSSQNVRIISQLMFIVVQSKYFYDSDWLKVPGLFFIPATFDQIGDTFVL